MSNLSLAKSIQTCKIDTGEAPRLLSDRFQNPHLMVCPIWDGTNLKGQQVCPDSFYTKSRGCNSAEDRVVVENDQRPDYISYITLNAAGIDGNIYDNVDEHIQSVRREKMLDGLNNVTGNFGKQFGAARRYTGCAVNAYDNGMAQMAQTLRKQGSLNNNAQAYSNMQYSGMHY